MSEGIVERYRAQIRAAAAVKSPLVIRGGGTKDFYGEAPVGDVLDAAAYAGVVDYDPTELVITARAGTRLVDVRQTLRASGQMLPCRVSARVRRWVARWRRGCRGRAGPTRARCAISSLACGSSTDGARNSRSGGVS